MGISILEFQTAMEIYGAERLPNCLGSRYHVQVPCFEVANISFFHSGSYYIVQRPEASNEIMNKAMAEFDEYTPGGKNFWWGEIHSVRGILTLASMLENKYSKDFVEELTYKTYKKILESPFIQQVAVTPLIRFSKYWKDLIHLVEELDHVVNPFVNGLFHLKDPSQYLSEIELSIASRKDTSGLSLSTVNLEASFSCKKDSFNYSLIMPTSSNKEDEKGWLQLVHYITSCNDTDNMENVIYLNYNANGDYKEKPEDIDLRIDLINGFAWKTYDKDKIKPVSNKQLHIMIKYLKIIIKQAENELLKKMVE